MERNGVLDYETLFSNTYCMFEADSYMYMCCICFLVYVYIHVCLFVVQNVMMVILVSWMVQWLVKDVWSIAREDDGEQCAMATGDHLRLLWYADKMDFPLTVCVYLCMDVYSAYMYVS